MSRPQLNRVGWLFLCLLTFALPAFPQAPANQPNSESTNDAGSKAEILYTGKHIGYFRFPTRQSGTVDRCPALSKPTPKGEEPSPAAVEFFKERDKHKNAILVGTGDNFAPQLEARVFHPLPSPTPPDPNYPHAVKYQPGNKELYNWYQGHWVSIDHQPDGLKKLLAGGNGTIPNDNVGCFLSAAGYAAIVPGKHDFYFGAERVRQLARFMADRTEEGYRPVQMLGANLVIKTTPLKETPSVPDKEEWEWPEDFAVLNLEDGKTVYPWLSYVQLKMMDFKANSKLPTVLKNLLRPENGPTTEDEFLSLLAKVEQPDSSDDQKALSDLRKKVKEFSGKHVYVCLSKGAPNDFTTTEDCLLKESREVRLSGNLLVYDLPLKSLTTAEMNVPASFKAKDGHFSTLQPGRNYGLCFGSISQPGRKDKEIVPCMRFSVHTPFFYHPHPVPAKGERNYTDPDPFAFLEKNETNGRPQETAIFGIVDTNLGQQVGVLNFSWLRSDEYKTVVSAEDPAQALREQLDYFRRWYEKNHDGKQFSGLKILLAQASPQRARVLAARFPDFQIVVTGADQEQATSQTRMSTVWAPNSRAGAFIAVPTPYYDYQQPNLEGVVHLGLIEVLQKKPAKAEPASEESSWNLTAQVLKPTPIQRLESSIETEPSALFPSLVDLSLKKCLPSEFTSKKPGTPFERVKWLTLCAMRTHTGADVALIQKRDFYNELSASSTNEREQVQQLLDRILWKGDLLTLLYIPGSALKQALAKSKAYAAEDSSILSLADERWRNLEYLGVRYDPSEKKYFVNETPIDDKKIYAVATTDYIASGDTGYPELPEAALNPRRHPKEYAERLIAISSIVCDKLFPETEGKYCLRPIVRDNYLDVTVAQVTPSASQPGFVSKLLSKVNPWPPVISTAEGTADALEQVTQRRPIWTLSLRNLSVGFTGLYKDLSDKEITDNFAGVSTSGVNATKTQTLTTALNLTGSRRSHRNESFFDFGVDYKNQWTGDGTGEAHRLVDQLNNRLTGDIGHVWDIRGGRAPVHLGLVLTLHAETPFRRPFTTFTLSTKDASDRNDQLTITQERNWLVLPRLGFRWQIRANSIEGGIQWGREFDALDGYRFVTQGTPVECPPDVKEPFADCIKRLSKPAIGSITKDSTAEAILHNRRRAGFYVKSNWSIPFNAKIKYEINHEGNLFFNFHEDNITDTRYWHLSKHSLKFSVFPSLSFGPTVQLILYQNKVKPEFLFQRTIGFEASFAFNLFNWREKQVQVKHKP